MREAPSIITIRKLVENGVFIHAHDPKAIEEAKKHFREISAGIRYFANTYKCLYGADALFY